MKKTILLSLFFLFFTHLSFGQQADTLRFLDHSPVLITAAKLESSPQRIPFAVTTLTQTQLQQGQAQLSLQEAISSLPGVFSMSADNFAQDLKLAVRGFGARSAFGVRGLRIIVDGLPESTPDGQADTDNIDVGVLQQLELLRGASAGLYGNAAGGVLYLKTEESSKKSYIEAQTTFGSFGFRRFQAKTGFKIKKRLGIFASVSQQQLDGYRAQSAMKQTVANLKINYTISNSLKIALRCNYGNSPFALDAGGLTIEQVTDNRRQARPANVQFKAGETVEQGRVGLVLDKTFSNHHSLKFTNFLTTRTFSNRLSFKSGGVGEINRLFGGSALNYFFTQTNYRTQLGIEFNQQRDLRKRFNNLDGTKSDLTFDQKESFENVAFFWLNEYTPSKKWLFTTATRFDKIRLRADDYFLSDGNQSGEQLFYRFNPTLGGVFLPNKKISFYTNVASNFETPTLNELSANPSNAGGFNAALKPQKSVNYEIGTKIKTFSTLNFDLALFRIDLRDEFVPYQLDNAVGRTFYRNAGKSLRKGLETSLNWSITQGLYVTTNYTYSDFRYVEYVANGIKFDGNQQPLSPKHSIFAAVSWTHRLGFFVMPQIRTVSRFFVNDENSVSDKGYTLVAVRGGYTTKIKNHVHLDVFGGVNNLFGTAYNGSVLINALGKRYFEPSPNQATFYVGMKVKI